MLRSMHGLLLGCVVIAGPALADSPAAPQAASKAAPEAAVHAASPAANSAALPAGCDTFSWNVSAELALFAQPGTAIAAGADAKQAPTVQVGHLYAVGLVEQAKVNFAHTPGKTRLADGAHGGLLAIRLTAAGKYRVTIDKPSWVDVTDTGALVNSNQFQGRPTCPLIHKSVEYTLPAGKLLLIQLSGETSQTVRLAVTPVP
ncbi:MAG: hypothetical protein JSS24_11000 [Proteobacteria bacterium]|nr:hypothetical protein [Pseudomonadota bacterium]